MRCIAYHELTGDRCPKMVGISPAAQTFKLCRKHAKSILLTLPTDAAKRDELARGRWTNVRDLQ